MTELLTAAKDALAELEALITGRGPYAGERVVGPDAGKVADRLQAAIERTEAGGGALWEFARRVEPGDHIEYSTCGDGSASLTVVRDRVRVLTLTLGGWQAVYDLTQADTYPRELGKYRVWSPEEAER